MDGFLLLLFAPWRQGTGCLKLWVLQTAQPLTWAAQCAVAFSPWNGLSCHKERCAETVWLHSGTMETGGSFFFPLLRRKLRENQAARVPRKWSVLSVGTHNYACGRTESVHPTLPEMKEKTTVISISCEQWLGTEGKDILLASLSHQAVSSHYNWLYWDTEARFPRPFQKKRHRWHLYCGRA